MQKNSTKNQKIRFKSKKSDLNQKNLIFSIFLWKIVIFSNPAGERQVFPEPRANSAVLISVS